MATVRIRTTQNVTLALEIANLGDRLLAAVVDTSLQVAWLYGVTKFLELTGLKGTLLNYVEFAVLLVPVMFYNLLTELFFNGQSLGKRLFHLRVVRLDGAAPSLGDYLMRWLLRLVDTAPPFLGVVAIITIAINGRGQRLGDLAAGTTVVSLRPEAALLPPPLLAGYAVVFPQAARLADPDVALLRHLIYRADKLQNVLLLNEVAMQVKRQTGIYTDLPDRSFLETVLRDHAHLTMLGS